MRGITVLNTVRCHDQLQEYILYAQVQVKCSMGAVWCWAGCRCQLSDALLQDYGFVYNPLLSSNNIHRSLATCRHISEGPGVSESWKQEALNLLPATLNPALQRGYKQYLNEPDNKVLSPWHH